MKARAKNDLSEALCEKMGNSELTPAGRLDDSVATVTLPSPTTTAAPPRPHLSMPCPQRPLLLLHDR